MEDNKPENPIIKFFRCVMGRYFTQPLHKTLEDFNVLSVLLLISCNALMWDIWFHIEAQGVISENWLSVMAGLLLALVAKVWALVGHMYKMSRNTHRRTDD